jgi:mRNA interferase MazF
MKKNIIEIFDNWNIEKKILEKNSKILFFNEREIWWCKLGTNLGHEENGKGDDFLRPILIIKKFNKHIFLGIPLSTKIKENNRYYIKFLFKDEYISALISQIKCIDSKRPHFKIGKITDHSFKKIKNSVTEFF